MINSKFVPAGTVLAPIFACINCANCVLGVVVFGAGPEIVMDVALEFKIAFVTNAVVAILVELSLAAWVVENDALVALVALPDSVAVIVPALKFPLESLATTLSAVLAEVASTAKVLTAEPSNAVPNR